MSEKIAVSEIIEGCSTIDIDDILSKKGVEFNKDLGVLCLVNMQSVFREYKAKLSTGWKPEFSVQNMLKNTACVYKTVGRIQENNFGGCDDVGYDLTNHTYRVFYYLIMNGFIDVEIKTDCDTCGRHLATKENLINGVLCRCPKCLEISSKRHEMDIYPKRFIDLELVKSFTQVNYLTNE